MMKNSQLLTFILLCFAFSMQGKLIAQTNQHNFSWYDSATYQAYLLSDWKTVLKSGHEAIKKGEDYFYLRMRMGDAAYATHDFRAATTHFSKALQFNKADEYAREMQYYSLLQIGNTDEANTIAKGFSKETKQRLKIKNGVKPEFLYVESGISISAIPQNIQGWTTGSDTVYAEREYQSKLGYFHAGSRFRLLPELYVFGGVTAMNIERTKDFKLTTLSVEQDSIIQQPYGSDYIYTFSPKVSDTTFLNRINQNDVYANVSWLPGARFKVTAAFHFFSTRMHTFYPLYSVSTVSDTAYYLSADESWHLFDYQQDKFNFIAKDTSLRNSVVYLGVSREIGDFTLGLNASRSDFNTSFQKQIGASLQWYPLGNTNLYAGLSVSSILRDSTSNLVYEPLVGGRILKNTWISAFVTTGNLNLYNEKAGYLVYNQADPITFRAGVDVQSMISKNLELYLIYRYQQKQSTERYLKNSLDAEQLPVQIVLSHDSQYVSQNLTAGIKWKF